MRFFQQFKPISISLSPNVEKEDIRLALKLINNKKEWKEGDKIKELENEFKKYLGVKNAISFNSGRSAFLAILNAIKESDPSFANASEGKEILLQAFTCNAVPNPIIWSGFKPIYVDCDEKTFNIDVVDLKKKITAKSRVVVVQHTFGLPADLDEILEICQKNNLILIEDCAHSLGAEYGSTRVSTERLTAEGLSRKSSPQAKGKKVGTFGKVSFLSFSRDKVISSVYGGMAVTDDDNLAKKIKEFQEKLDYPSDSWILQQLLHPILMEYLILPTYSILGKYILIFFQWLHILSKAVHWTEKRGRKPDYFPKRLPNALAVLALNQFKRLDKFNEYRRVIAEFYYENLKDSQFQLPPEFEDRKQIFLRFTIKHPKAHEIIRTAWQKNILIGDWYNKVIAPHDTKLEKMRYRLGSCPKAEKLAKETFNLPTHINISKQDAEKTIQFLREFK
jgi:dTDP-4-amino-4,6-dideoxygalactose transaminase